MKREKSGISKVVFMRKISHIYGRLLITSESSPDPARRRFFEHAESNPQILHKECSSIPARIDAQQGKEGLSDARDMAPIGGRDDSYGAAILRLGGTSA
jgi:hypothetical protein